MRRKTSWPLSPTQTFFTPLQPVRRLLKLLPTNSRLCAAVNGLALRVPVEDLGHLVPLTGEEPAWPERVVQACGPIEWGNDLELSMLWSY